MRVRPALPVCLLAFVLLAAPAGAQDPDGEPGCAQSNPCEVEVGLEADGIYDLSYDTFGTGDWILLSVYNEDDQPHTLRLEGHDFEFSIEGGDIDDTQPFKLGAPGTYDLTDQPSGDVRTITIEDHEVFTDPDSETDGKSNPMPGPAPALLVLGLAAAVALSRRT